MFIQHKMPRPQYEQRKAAKGFFKTECILSNPKDKAKTMRRVTGSTLLFMLSSACLCWLCSLYSASACLAFCFTSVRPSFWMCSCPLFPCVSALCNRHRMFEFYCIYLHLAAFLVLMSFCVSFCFCLSACVSLSLLCL